MLSQRVLLAKKSPYATVTILFHSGIMAFNSKSVHFIQQSVKQCSQTTLKNTLFR